LVKYYSDGSINVAMGCVWNVEYWYYHSTAFKII